jgi:hypothetical protein
MSGFFLNLGIFLIYLHFPKYAMDNGSSESEASLYLSIAGMCSCIGRILLGMACYVEMLRYASRPYFFCLWIVYQICSYLGNMRSSYHIYIKTIWKRLLPAIGGPIKVPIPIYPMTNPVPCATWLGPVCAAV